MSRQDKATTDRNAKILRALVKAPDNKVCADCRRNDARWAAWNLGVFVCIRCSGIHRSMGTHISKVKSVDLDIWQPEQMEQIQRWGNKLGNLYWEAHLKPGHVPPEHKIDSFIRSKYESRRWALEGPMPTDPQVLLAGTGSPAASPPPPAAVQAPPPPRASAPTPTAKSAPAHPLLSRSIPSQQQQKPPATAAQNPLVSPTPTPAPAAPAPPTASSSLFDLDFHAPPTPPAGAAPRGNNKTDIMSLFSAPPPAQPQQLTAASSSSDIWGSSAAAAPTSAFGGMSLGGGSNGWGAPAPSQPAAQSSFGGGADIWGSSVSAAPPAPAPATNLWSTPAPAAQQPPAPSSSSLWDAQPASSNAWASAAPAPAPAGKNGNLMNSDAFADIWK